HTALETGEVGAQAEVQPVAEGQVLDVVAADVVDVRVLVPTGVAVRGRDQEQDRAAGGDGRAVVLDVFGDVASGGVAGRLEPQRLVDHVRDQGPVLDDGPPFVGVLGEDLGEPADQA